MARVSNIIQNDDDFDPSMVEPISKKAKSFSDKFNVSGLLEFFSGGSTATKVANKMLGNKKDDSKTGSKKDPLFSTVSAGRLVPLKKDDSVSDVTAKLYNLLKHSYDRKVKNDEIENIFKEHADREKERRHQELLKAISGFGLPVKGKKKDETMVATPEQPGTSWVDKAITAAKFIPSVVGGVGSFILAATPILALAEAARQAGEADINDTEQGIVEPLKKTYEKLADGDWSGALDAASKFNVFTATGRAGLEFSKEANVALGNVEKWEQRREENRAPEKEIATDKYRRPESLQKMITAQEERVKSAKSEPAKKQEQLILDKLLDTEKLQKKQVETAQQVPSPTPATDRVNTGTVELKDNEAMPAKIDTQVSNSTAVTGSAGSETATASPSARNQDETYKKAQRSSAVRP